MPDDESESIAESLLHTVADGGAVDAFANFGEVAIDSLLDEGVVRDVPIVGTLVGLARTGLAVRDRLFLRKVWRFMIEQRSFSARERGEFKQKLVEDPEHRKKVGETLFVLLDRLDDLAKSTLVGRAFAAYLRGDVDFLNFQRLAKAIDRVILIEDLNELSGWADDLIGQLPSAVGLSLQGAGLVEPRSVPNAPYAGGMMEYQKTSLGTKMVEVVLR